MCVHFAQALDRAKSIRRRATFRGPRLGFYGVIDERFDSNCSARWRTRVREWQIVLVGPVVKIDPAHCRGAPNIHYLGQQPYEALPQFLAGWDVCLLPFALNESTRFISPTKTLEYMAAELPIVSTPITDVVEPVRRRVRDCRHARRRSSPPAKRRCWRRRTEQRATCAQDAQRCWHRLRGTRLRRQCAS